MTRKLTGSLLLLAGLCATFTAASAQTAPADLAPGKPDFVPAKRGDLAPGKSDSAPAKSGTAVSPTALLGIYKLLKNHYIPLNDDYAPLRAYNPSKPSSRGATIDELIKASAKTVREQVGNRLVIDHTVQLTPIEAAALASPLPAVAPGNYGFILSATVQKIVDKDTVILSDIQLINEDELKRVKDNFAAEEKESKARARNRAANNRGVPDEQDMGRRFDEKIFEQRTRLTEVHREGGFKSRVRLHGFNTENAIEKSRWTGPTRSGFKQLPTPDPAGPNNSQLHIAIVAVGDEESDKKPAAAPTPDATKRTSGPPAVGSASVKYASKRPGKRVFEAVPVEWFIKGITEEQFKDLIAKRGMTQQEFLEMAQKELKRDTDQAPDRIIDALEKKREELEENAKEK